jgi:hypothetical protein
MKILIAENDAGALQRLQNVHTDVCDRTMLRPIPFSGEQELQQRTMSHRFKRRGFKS